MEVIEGCRTCFRGASNSARLCAGCALDQNRIKLRGLPSIQIRRLGSDMRLVPEDCLLEQVCY